MSKRDDLIAKYHGVLRDKFGVEPDPALLDKVVKACGPSIYNPDGEVVATSKPEELAAVRRFATNKLGVGDEAKIDAAIDKVIEEYGRSTRNKFRAVMYYRLAQHLGKESALT
ncbi:MAG: DUF2853 family protein [Paracoccaceae bacterium]